MWSKIVISVWLLIIQNALGDVAETMDDDDVIELIRYCDFDDLEGVKELTAKFGPEQIVEAQDSKGRTCLNSAIFKSLDTDLLSYLLQNGADPNQKMDDTTPLSAATYFCNLSKVKALLDYGADAKYDHSDALYDMDCEIEEQREMARLLLQHCADPDADKPGRRHRTPFLYAVYRAEFGEIREMAVWMETKPNIKREDVANAYKHLYNDIVETINEAREERKMLQEAEREEPLGGGGDGNACSPLTSSIAQ